LDKLRAIQIFMRIAETGSFSKAADLLQLQKGTVTKCVQELESELNVRLLRRTTRRVTVTVEGEQYYKSAAQLLESFEQVEQALGAAQGTPRGRLRIDVVGHLAQALLIPRLPGFYALFPEVQIRLGMSDRMINLIEDNLDCVIRGGHANDPNLVSRKLFAAQWVTCASPAYLAQRGVPAHPRDLLSGHDIVNYEFTHTGKALDFDLTDGNETIPMQATFRLTVNEFNAVPTAGLAGLGIVRILDYMAQPFLESGRLVAILDAWHSPPYPFYVVYQPARNMQKRQRVFIDWLIEQFVRPAADTSAAPG
jgi:LysR family transcriptional regulator, regulator for bpeEF and oprC